MAIPPSSGRTASDRARRLDGGRPRLVDVPIGQIVQRQLHDARLRRDRHEADQPPPIVVTTAVKSHPTALPPYRIERPETVAEVYQALVVGTRDYVQKSNFSDVIVALSGGIDSALVGAVAVDALGAGARPRLVAAIALLLGRFDCRRTGARRPSGHQLVSMPIEDMHQAALDTLAREFKASEPGTAEENVQSRIRGLLVMALSNKSGAMVLTTGNKLSTPVATRHYMETWSADLP